MLILLIILADFIISDCSKSLDIFLSICFVNIVLKAKGLINSLYAMGIFDNMKIFSPANDQTQVIYKNLCYMLFYVFLGKFSLLKALRKNAILNVGLVTYPTSGQIII
jgi:hypothetical protein